jgi:hypothetical protein
VQGEWILNFPKAALLCPFTDLCRLPHVWNAHCGEKLNQKLRCRIGVARLDRLGYRSAGQLLAEKFHTSEEMIKLLNRGKRLDSAGIVIIVPTLPMGGRMVRSLGLRSISRPRSFVRSGAMMN